MPPERGQELHGDRLSPDQHAMLVVGSYVAADRPGIHVFALDAESGALTERDGVSGVPFPAYVVPSADRPCLYAVSETTSTGPVGPGTDAEQVGRAGTVWLLRRESNGLRISQHRESGGQLPTHLSLAVSGRWLVVSNYGCGAAAGSVAVFPVSAAGEIGELVDWRAHSGSGPVAERQQHSHVHSSTFSPTGRALITADLGADLLCAHRFDDDTGALQLIQTCRTPPGWGPRYLQWSDDARTLYVVGELSGEVGVFAYDPAEERLTMTSSTPTSQHGVTSVLPSDIHLHPNGELLYVANRGAANSISVLRIGDGADPVLISETPAYGMWPRDFAVSPDGRLLVIANQHSNELSVVRLDADGLPMEQLSTTPCDAVSSVMFCEPFPGQEQTS